MKTKLLFYALLLAGCTGLPPINPGPRPTPDPTPTPPSPQCGANQSYSCWHFPPESRTWLYACPVYDVAGNVMGILNVVGGPPQCPQRPIEPPTTQPTPPPNTGGGIPQPPFSVRFPVASAVIISNTKDYSGGFDHTTLIENDDDLCKKLHGPQGHSPCHTDSGFFAGGQKEREAYDAWMLAGARDGKPLPPAPLCPVWQFKVGDAIRICHDDHNAAASCDHFGNTSTRDDPQTPLPTFEGEPKYCAAQADGFGPYAGFFTIAHGDAEIRSCPPLDTAGPNCGPWRRFNH